MSGAEQHAQPSPPAGTPPARMRWVRLVALACFGAGIAVGLAVPRVLEAFRPASSDSIDPDQRYIQFLTKECDLSAEQVRSLRMIIRADAADSREALRREEEKPPRLVKVQARTEARIHALLNDEQRSLFERLR